MQIGLLWRLTVSVLIAICDGHHKGELGIKDSAPASFRLVPTFVLIATRKLRGNTSMSKVAR